MGGTNRNGKFSPHLKNLPKMAMLFRKISKLKENISILWQTYAEAMLWRYMKRLHFRGSFIGRVFKSSRQPAKIHRLSAVRSVGTFIKTIKIFFPFFFLRSTRKHGLQMRRKATQGMHFSHFPRPPETLRGSAMPGVARQKIAPCLDLDSLLL